MSETIAPEDVENWLAMHGEMSERVVGAYLAQRQAEENAEGDRLHDELVAYAAERGWVIVAIVQALPDGSAAVPIWGVTKKKA